ncbi:MAG: hypothetical protein ACYC3I_19050 [Gemmataceae bacterium]
MSRDDIVRMLQQRPFQPFRLRLSEGIVHEIRHPEMVMATATSLIVGTPAANAPFPAVGDYVIISLLHVVQLEPLPVPASPNNN